MVPIAWRVDELGEGGKGPWDERAGKGRRSHAAKLFESTKFDQTGPGSCIRSRKSQKVKRDIRARPMHVLNFIVKGTGRTALDRVPQRELLSVEWFLIGFPAAALRLPLSTLPDTPIFVGSRQIWELLSVQGI